MPRQPQISAPPPASPRPRRVLRRNLRACILDGFLYCVMLGLAEQYLPRFVMELKLGQIASGLIATVPLFIAALLQLFTPALVRRVGCYRRVFSFSAAVQAAVLVPLAAIALTAHLWIPAHRDLVASMESSAAPGAMHDLLLFLARWFPTAAVFLVVTIYAAGAGVGGPAWSGLVAAMIPSRIQARYFGFRNLVLGIGLLAGIVAGSQLLEAAEDPAGERFILGVPSPMFMFAVMFLGAAIARAASAYYLSRYIEPRPSRLPLPINVSPAHFVHRLRRTHHGRALVFLLLAQTAHLLAFPYFNPYFKEKLGLDDGIYGVLLASFFLGKLVAPAPVGRAVHRFGVHRVVIAAAAALAPVPLFLMASDSIAWLIAAQFISGAALSAFELCSFLVQLEHVRAVERASVLSQFGVLFNSAGLLGSIAGGAILRGAGTGGHGYAILFASAAGLRLLALAAFPRGRGSPPSDLPAFEPASGEAIAVLTTSAQQRPTPVPAPRPDT